MNNPNVHLAEGDRTAVSDQAFGGLALLMSARSQSIPFASILAHSAGGSLIERKTMTSSGGLGGLPRGRFSCSMLRTVAPIYRYTNNPCNPDLSCYHKSMETKFRLRDHFTLKQWQEMLGMQRVAECEARRTKQPFTECTQVYGSRALVPLYEQMGDLTRPRNIA
jgi:hypothetical protein